MSLSRNELELDTQRRKHPVVGDGEKIAVFGAGGQIGTKLRPVLERLYPGQVIYCESGPTAAERGFTPLDVTKEDEVRTLIRDNNVKVIINLAALLSAAADKNPAAALKVNFAAPLKLLEIAKEEGVRKVQMMSSMASQEFDERMHDSDAVKTAKKALRENASNSLHAVPDGLYGLQKSALEMSAQMYALHYDLDVSMPRLAGVLNAHTPWPSNGTTEELDKLIVAAAAHEVYGDRWEGKMRTLIGEEALKNGHYLRDGKYVPEVSADATFDMVDGRTLPQAVVLLLHKDLRGQGGINVPGAVHNVSEYSVSMEYAVDVLHQLNPAFPVVFATDTKTGLDQGKMTRARIWPASQDTKSTEYLIGDFKQYSAAQSIGDSYRRVVEELRRRELDRLGVEPRGSAVAAARR